MNAIELADELDIFAARFGNHLASKSADMLREQADRIAELELLTKQSERCFPFVEVSIEGTNDVIRFIRDGNSEEGTYHISKEELFEFMDNQYERIKKLEKQRAELEKDLEACEYFLNNSVKHLTDEDIVKVYKEIHDWDVKLGDKNWIGFARAIIEKLMTHK